MYCGRPGRLICGVPVFAVHLISGASRKARSVSEGRSGLDADGGGPDEGAFFQGEVGVHRHLGGLDVLVSEPEGDDGAVDVGME